MSGELSNQSSTEICAWSAADRWLPVLEDGFGAWTTPCVLASSADGLRDPWGDSAKRRAMSRMSEESKRVARSYLSAIFAIYARWQIAQGLFNSSDQGQALPNLQAMPSSGSCPEGYELPALEGFAVARPGLASTGSLPQSSPGGLLIGLERSACMPVQGIASLRVGNREQTSLLAAQRPWVDRSCLACGLLWQSLMGEQALEKLVVGQVPGPQGCAMIQPGLQKDRHHACGVNGAAWLRRAGRGTGPRHTNQGIKTPPSLDP